MNPTSVPFHLTTGDQRYDLSAWVARIGADLVVMVYGGDRPHVGAVSAAQPRPSGRDPEATSATASTLCFPGHKEDELTRAMALALASHVGGHVVVTAGAHWDVIDETGIKAVMANAAKLGKAIEEALANLQ